MQFFKKVRSNHPETVMVMITYQCSVVFAEIFLSILDFEWYLSNVNGN